MAEATGPQLVPVAIEDEMRQAYLDYSMSVIVGRALPDVRDGLKPVHRRILYAMFDQGMLHNKRYSKAAGTVGEVLKKYHPHGDRRPVYRDISCAKTQAPRRFAPQLRRLPHRAAGPPDALSQPPGQRQ